MVKNSPANGRDDDLIPGLERSHEEGIGNLSSILTLKILQLGATVHGVRKSQTQLSTLARV